MKSLNSIFIYLASRSERRIEFLDKMRLAFKPVPSAYHEADSGDPEPALTVMRHAFGKAQGAKLPKRIRSDREEFILGADTIVYFKKRILGKPKNMAAAKKMLTAMSGKVHRVYTGIALIHRKSGKVWFDYAESKVRFRKLGRKAIEEYIQKVPPLDKAGAYAIQCQPRIVAEYVGSRSNIVGLPLELLRALLRDALKNV